MTALLETRDLAKTYDTGGTPVAALIGVDLTVRRGEFVAVMGPSGCGKSTLLNLVAGLDRPSAGEVWFDGRRIDQLSETALAKLRRRRIGFVFQFFNLLPTLSAEANVELPLLLTGTHRREARRQARGLLTDLGIGDKGRSAPSRLSGGQQQRVAIVRALAMQPDILLLDEVTSALDPELVAEVLDVIRELAGEGMTMVIATHEMGFARDVADRVCFLDAGVILEEGPPTEVLFHPREARTRQFLDRIISAGRL